MKTTLLQTALRLRLLLLLLAALLPAAVSQAQPITPPNLMSYQGYLTDGSGNPLGATNTGPKNYNVVFRFWNVQTAGTTNNELYAEQQTVTVDNGYFSVLLGEGSQFGNEPYGPLANVFISPLATKLFIEFDVQGVGAGGTDVKIAPRLQLLSSPYAFLAANANGLASSAGSNLLTTTAGGALNLSGPLNLGTGLGVNTIAGNGSGLTSLNASQVTSGTLPSGQLSGTYANALTFNNGNNNFNGTHTGNGNGLTSLNPAQLTSGTAANALTFNNNGNSFTGNGSGLSSLNANNISSGTLADARLPGDVARTGIYNDFTGEVDFSGVTDFYSEPYFYANAFFADYVGIGTSTPGYPLDVESWNNPALGAGFWYRFLNATGNSGNTYDDPVSIYASQGIQSGEAFYITSDQRIKKDLRKSDSIQDLDKLNRLQVTDYRLKDTITYGDKRKKGFIAQEVEKIFPEAVNTQTGVVPDIYQPAACKEGWVELATDLKKGERVRLVAEKAEGVYEVLEVAAGRFRTDFKPKDGKLFVFGREVSDYHSLDYTTIGVLNVSATQELARRLEQKSAQVDQLQQEMTELKKLVAQLAAESKSAKLAAQASAADRPAADVAPRKLLTTASLER